MNGCISRSIIIILLVSACAHPRLSAQYHYWAARAGSADSSGTESALAVIVDGQNQTYIAGQFTGDADFGTIHVTSHGGNDAFIAKLNAQGEFLWVQSGGGKGNDYINALAFTADGGIAALGVFSDSAAFDTSHLNTFLRSYFLSRYDTSGSLTWIKDIGMEGEGDHAGLCSNGSGSLYATYGTHISKFAANGTTAWDIRPGVIAYENSIGISHSGALYVTGQFGNSVTFGSTTLSAPGLFDYDLFVARLDTNGNSIWAKSAGSRTPLNKADAGIDLTVDEFGTVIVTGTYFGKAGFGADTLQSPDTTGSFVAMYSTNGNIIWIENLGLYSPSFATAVTTGSDGYVTVAGYGGADRSGSGGPDTRGGYIVRIHPEASTVQWSSGIGGPGVIPRDLAFTTVEGLTIAGSFSGDCSFFGKPVTAAGSTDLFTAYLPNIEGVEDHREVTPRSITLSPAFPNPFNPSTTIILSVGNQNTFPVIVRWQVYDVTGRVVDPGGTLDIRFAGDTPLQVTPHNLASGIYYCKVTAGGRILIQPLLYVR